MKFGIPAVITIVIAFITILVTYLYAVEFSAFAFGLGKVAISIVLFWLFDYFILHDVDTIEELKKGNVAYAIFLLALAILVAVAIGTV